MGGCFHAHNYHDYTREKKEEFMKSTQLQINHRDYCKTTTEICNLDCLTLSAYGEKEREEREERKTFLY